VTKHTALPTWALASILGILALNALRGIVHVHHDCSCYVEVDDETDDEGEPSADPQPSPPAAKKKRSPSTWPIVANDLPPVSRWGTVGPS
jgi:hypothetical protein